MKKHKLIDQIFMAIIPFMLFGSLSVNAFTGKDSVLVQKGFPEQTLNIENNLLDNQTNAVVTDKLGFTWISTYFGLQRFTGYTLVTINPVVNGDTFHINYPVYLFALHDGSIWISIHEGILKYNPDKDQFALIIRSMIGKGNFFGMIPLKETTEGIWCMQQHEGIVLYSPDGRRLSELPSFQHTITDSILQSPLLLTADFVASDQDRIYLVDLNTRILSIDLPNRSCHVINLPKSYFFAIACSHHKLFVANNTGIICINNKDHIEFTKEILGKTVTRNITRSCLFTMPNNDLLCSRDQYLYALDTNGIIKYELTDMNRNPFLATGFISHLYADNRNRIWLLTNNDVKRVQNVQMPFDHYAYRGAENNFIRTLYYDEQKELLLAGGYNGGIQAYDTSARPLWPMPLSAGGVGYITSIDKLNTDHYLLVNFHAGWFELNAATRRITPFNIPPSLQNTITRQNFIDNLQRIDDSTILVAAENNVFECSLKENRLVKAKPLLPVDLVDHLNCFLCDMDKILWIGTNNGSLIRLIHGILQTIHIPGNYSVRCMSQDEQKNVWIGTEKGLLVYDKDGNLLSRVTVESGLRNDFIYSLLPTSGGAFVATNLGLSNVSLNGAVRNFSKQMGLQDNEFNTEAAIKNDHGKLFFGGVNGITAFYPSSLYEMKDSASVCISRLEVNDSSLNSSSGIWNGDTLLLNYHQNNLKIEFAAMGLFSADEYIYEYRMLSSDTTWQKVTSQPATINYTLPPGQYNLEIKCQPSLSPNQVLFKSYSIYIYPPWWDILWFRTLILLAGAGIIYFFVHRYNRRKYINRIKKLEVQQQIQTERERISRELHDNIGSQVSLIINSIDWTIHLSDDLSKDDERNRLISINETARSVMSNLRESIWALNKEKISLEEFADRLKSYVQHIIPSKPELEFSFKEEIQQNISLSPTETLNLFRICQECINNVFQHAQATSLKVSIHSVNNHSYIITIEDNGKGFDPSKKINNHYGLENMKHRAGELNARLSMYSEMDKGSKITISK